MKVNCKLNRSEGGTYDTEVRNRFEALGDIDDLEEEHDMILAT